MADPNHTILDLFDTGGPLLDADPDTLDLISELLSDVDLAADTSDYPAPFVLKPFLTHLTTLIMLHGTSTSGDEFGETFIRSIRLPSAFQGLRYLLPHTKFVFPTGKPRPTTVFEGRDSNAWFDITSFTDRTIDETKQIQGIKESLLYLEGVILAEVAEFEDAGRVVVGGFSQGCAIVGMLMASGMFEETEIGGWIGMSGWLPFRIQIDGVARDAVTGPEDSVREVYAAKRLAVKGYVSKDMLGITAEGVVEEAGTTEEEGPEKKQRLWMGHGVNDEKVPLAWGVQMKNLMLNLGYNVTMKEYEGLEHSVNETETRDIIEFLKGRWAQYLPVPSSESPETD